jgi:type IV pilus assembly protein PilC
MEEFIYIAKNEKGDTIRASIAAASRYEAIALLREQALTVIELARGAFPSRLAVGKTGAASLLPPPQTPQHPFAKLSRIKLSDLAIFCRQLSITINAGLPLRDSLETIAIDMEHPALRRVIQGLIEALHDGKTFSQALALYPKAFNTLMVSLMAAAEESGSLPQTLNQVAGYLERTERLTRKIASITAYPMFVAGFFGFVCCIMTLFVLPKFKAMFEGFHTQLPLITRAVFGGNQFILDHFVLLLVAVSVLITAACLYRRTPSGRLRIDALKLRMPLVGTCLSKFIMARVCRNLAVMIRGGVPVTSALEIISRVSDNRVMERSVMSARERVMGGADIAVSLAEEKVFPRLVVSMVGVGEQSGRLPEVLERISDLYEDQVEGAVMVATALFEPIMICFFGAIVLVLMLAIYMPIFMMGSASVH